MEKQFEVVRISQSQHELLLGKLAKDVLGDFDNGGLISSTYISSSWLKLTESTIKSSTRYLHCAPCQAVPDNTIWVKEDVYRNLCYNFKFENSNKLQSIYLQGEVVDFSPSSADSLKISPLAVASCNITDQDEEALLSSYFLTPKHLYEGDVFAIPLSNEPSFCKQATYLGISELYFHVKSATLDSKTNSEGFYVLKGYCDIYCTPASPLYLPIKAELVSFGDDVIKRVPPDLEACVKQLSSLLAPFTKTTKPECLPWFMVAGSEGSGKVLAIKLVAELMGLHFLLMHSYELSDISVTAVEAKLDFILQRAEKIGPCIIAMTDIECIGKDKHGQEDVRLVGSFLDRITSALKKSTPFPIFFVGITDGKVDEVLPRITRAAVQVIRVPALDSQMALKTVSWIASCKGFRLSDENLVAVEKKLVGYVRSDLVLLVDHAVRNLSNNTTQRNVLQLRNLQYGLDLMDKAYSDSIGVAKVPDVKWDDVGGLTEVKDEIKLTLNMPSGRGQLRRSGMLFYGPPGTGKTLMAKAVATECGMNFLSVKGPELMNMYVGQSEKNVRGVFERGREASPCILFFDELDSVAPNRGKSGDGGGVTDRVVSQLLAEMDGLHNNRGLFVIAATNRPDLVDSALLRPGRFDKMFYLGPLTDTHSKLGVLVALTNKFKFGSDVDLREIAEHIVDHVTGADIYSVCSNAWLSAARRHVYTVKQGDVVEPALELEVSKDDLISGISEMVPSLTVDDLRYYQQLAASTSTK